MFLEMSLNESFHKLGEFLGLKTRPLHSTFLRHYPIYGSNDLLSLQ